MAKKRIDKKGDGMTLSDDKSVALDALERLIDREYAVALRRIERKVHVRAVREGAIIESEGDTIQEALNSALSKSKNKAEAKA